MKRKRTWLLLACVAMAGCVGPDAAKDQKTAAKAPFFERWEKAAANAALAPGGASLAGVPVGETTTLELHGPDVLPSAAERQLPTQIVRDLSVAPGTDVTVVLRMLARLGDQDILIGQNVKGPISLHLTSIPWDQGFRGVLAAAGLTYQWEGEILRVMTLDDMKHDLEMQKLEHEQRTVLAEQQKIDPLGMKVVKIKYASVTELAKSLQDLLSRTFAAERPVIRGSVTVAEESNTLIIHAINDDMDKMMALVERLDRPKPQVLIQASIVEANQNTARELGIQWGLSYSGIEGDKVYAVAPGTGAGGTYAANFPATLKDNAGMSIGFLGAEFGGGALLEMQLSALQEDGQIRILSNPSITTLDNETAHIESGEERAYRKTTGTGNELDVSIAWKKAVLKLEVTPHVIDRDHLKMEITATKDSFDETKPESTGEFPVNTKNAKTTVLIRNGETTVIGGLTQETEVEREFGIPVLKDIPLLGYLFRGSQKSSEFDETLIFITPQILLEEDN